MTPEMIAERLGRTGLCICPGFLDVQSMTETRDDLDSLQRTGELQRAAVGRGAHRQIKDEVRRDEIRWLDRELPNVAQAALWAKLDLLKPAFNRALFLGLADFEGHYASYPTGGFYRRHLDTFRDNDARVVSIVLYLNHHWLPSDGGQLRLYAADGSYVAISPVGGTLVCFMSGISEHEVMPGLRPRFSFAGWFKREAS